MTPVPFLILVTINSQQQSNVENENSSPLSESHQSVISKVI